MVGAGAIYVFGSIALKQDELMTLLRRRRPELAGWRIVALVEDLRAPRALGVGPDCQHLGEPEHEPEHHGQLQVEVERVR